MVRLDWQRLFGNRQRLRRHGKRKMADNRTNGMLMPVIDGKIWAAISRFQQSKLAKVAVAFAGVLGSAALPSAGRPKLAATIPNRRCGQKYRLPNCRQRVSIPLTFLPPDIPCVWGYECKTFFCARILSLKRTLHSSNDNRPWVNMLKKAAIAHYFNLVAGKYLRWKRLR